MTKLPLIITKRMMKGLKKLAANNKKNKATFYADFSNEESPNQPEDANNNYIRSAINDVISPLESLSSEQGTEDANNTLIKHLKSLLPEISDKTPDREQAKSLFVRNLELSNEVSISDKRTASSPFSTKRKEFLSALGDAILYPLDKEKKERLKKVSSEFIEIIKTYLKKQAITPPKTEITTQNKTSLEQGAADKRLSSSPTLEPKFDLNNNMENIPSTPSAAASINQPHDQAKMDISPTPPASPILPEKDYKSPVFGSI